MSIRADWIAVDWGTSRLRAWALDAQDRVLAHDQSDSGMSATAQGGFEAALLDCIGAWLDPERITEVIACGMVGARQGWIEAPYATTPCLPNDASRAVRAPTLDPRLSVRIIPGVCQSDPADVMRGEETQIAGHLAETGFEGMLCLPGTHTKWVTVRGGRITRFRTVMSGELFALLTEQSILRHSVGPGWDDMAFLTGVRRTRQDPSALIASLFSLRAEGLLRESDPNAARAMLSGLLLGAELAAIDPGDGPVAILGAEQLSQAYLAALEDTGIKAERVDAEAATLRGLIHCHHSLKQAV